MPDVIKTIKPGGGGDYTTLASWEAAISADPTDNQIAECYDGDCGGTLTMDVSNANGIDFTIRSATGESFRDLGSWPTVATSIDAGAAQIGSNSGTLVIATTKVFITDIIIFLASTAHHIQVSGELTINRCVVWNTRSQACDAGAADPGTINVYNTLWCFYNDIAVWCRIAGSVVNTINSTFLVASGETCDLVLTRSDGTFTATNTICLCSTGTKFSGSFDAASNYNMSNDNSAPGATNWRSVTIADIIVSQTAATLDAHMKASAFGSYIGSNQSATIGTKDVDDQTRTQYDIGADAKVVSGSRNLTLLGVG